MKHFDFIIVGAGSAGSVLAERLTASGRFHVLLVEAGPRDRHLLIQMPKGIGRLMGDTRFNWLFETEPDQGNGGKGEVWLRGKALGGSSSINGMVYNRGQPQDYDDLEKAGCTGWNWQSILPHFRQIEAHPCGGNGWRGGSGPLRITLPDDKAPLNKAMLEAGVSAGLQRAEDINEPHGKGIVAVVPHTIADGCRWSASRAFLAKARKRPNLTVLTETRCDRLIIQDGRCIGISCSGKGAGEYRAAREVILSAGALVSPCVLQRSGIGPAEDLARHGIDVLADRQEVGKNLQEHRVLFMQFRVGERRWSENVQYSGLRLAWHVARYLLARSGLMAAGSFAVGFFPRLKAGSERADAQILLTPYTIDTSKHPLSFQREPGITLFGFILRPDSLGSLELRSADPADPPRIFSNYLATANDQQAAIGIARYIRKLVSQSSLRGAVVEETQPGPSYQSDEDLLYAWRQFGGCGYHTVGTCRMGSDPDSVVDPRLRVRGVEGLRVMDCSVLPFIVSGNTNGPIMAMSSFAASLILEDHD